MANKEHLDIFEQGSNTWNNWRKQYPAILPDLSGADLHQKIDFSDVDLREVNLSGANLNGVYLLGTNLRRANLSEANLSRVHCTAATLIEANLQKADLQEAELTGAILAQVNLSGADLRGANLMGANFLQANLSGANLGEANLGMAQLVTTNLKDAILNDCSVYGISVWDVNLEGAMQKNLVITRGQPAITVDNLKIAQFIYLLLNNAEIQDAINTLTTKAVLILGRFSKKRKPVLNAIREELRNQDLLPILFDFDRPSSQTVREAVKTLAQLSYFIIADLTEQSSIAEELEIIIPGLVVPVKPLLHVSQKKAFSMFKGYGVFDWVLPIYRYADVSDLLTNLQEQIIEPAKQKAREWTEKKRQIEQR